MISSVEKRGTEQQVLQTTRTEDVKTPEPERGASVDNKERTSSGTRGCYDTLSTQTHSTWRLTLPHPNKKEEGNEKGKRWERNKPQRPSF
jgi:hypothetical protein